MFQDIKISEDLNVKFLDYLKSESTSTGQSQTMTNLVGLDFHIYVLQVIISIEKIYLIFLLIRLIHGPFLNQLIIHF